MLHNGMNTSESQFSKIVPQNVRDYAKSRGWARIETKQSNVAVYRSPIAGRYEQLVVPMDSTLDDYAERIADVVANLSRVEGRAPIDVANDLLTPDADTLRFANESLDADRGSIGILEGIQLLEGARRSILAAACSVLTPAQHHPRLSRAEADQLLKASRLNHTEQGSFVVAISCPLRAVDSDHSLIEEPFARRTTKLLARSVAKLVRAIENDKLDSIMEPSPNGPVVTSNLCEALLRMLPSRDDGGLRLSVSWSPVLPPDPETPREPIRIRKGYFKPIEELYERLRPKEGPKADFYVGTVETLNGALGDNNQRSGEVVLQLLYEEDLISVRCDLDAIQYRDADKAHMTGGVVVVRGILHRGGRIHRIQPVETFTVVSTPVENK
ncbi:MAG TPA: hypothetical protein VKX17_11730 [Planctomycetota bacterium]|nr:hypothetical protein [Planctomycetota bacterium]